MVCQRCSELNWIEPHVLLIDSPGQHMGQSLTSTLALLVFFINNELNLPPVGQDARPATQPTVTKQ